MENKNFEKANANAYATASLVLGIISVIGWIIHIGALWTLVLGIIGLCEACKAKKLGDESGKRTAGFVINLIVIIISAIACLPLLFIGGLAVSA